MIKRINELKPIDSEIRAIEIFEYIKDKIKEHSEFIGYKVWGNPADSDNNKTYKIEIDNEFIWICYVTWTSAATIQDNRKVILTAYPIEKSSIGQVLEVAFPYEFSRRFNTRLYENENIIEVRNYGRFTIGRRSLKRKIFFNYLRTNGLDDEILLDGDGKEYINIFSIQKDNLQCNYIKKQLVKWTRIVNDFKTIQRKICN
ncbi:hypothetical protein J0L31_11395 [Terrisporobacter glycolicus]|nr:hypothetical protein [Terrisporobacter glycolicus]